MRHSYIDAFSNLDSFLARLEPRVKIVAFLMLVLFIASVPNGSFICFILYAALLSGLFLLSGLPLLYIFKKSFAVLPFVLLSAVFIPFFKPGEIIRSYSLGCWTINLTYEGLSLFLGIAIKAFLCLFSIILLISTSRFTDLLKALESLRAPRLVILILSFMYRYMFILEDELMRMQQARQARSINRQYHLQAKASANMLGVLFIRAYERAENVYLAMCSRGFDGVIYTINQSRIRAGDIYFFLAVFILSAGIKITGWLI